ncbi:fibroin heavy chain-like [Schistocerca americana]|uniref:fibroin heavy chain-like n=1 Tax=Schistocerca americana TaxID=7009 RepID=UPI001F4F3C5A|nr:fibroin heavy chain-like [Schistocerca americana]
MASQRVSIFSLTVLVLAPTVYAASIGIKSGTALKANIGAGEDRGLQMSVGSGLKANIGADGGEGMKASVGSSFKANFGTGTGQSLKSNIGSGLKKNMSTRGGQGMKANIGSGLKKNIVIGGGQGMKANIGSGLKKNVGAKGGLVMKVKKGTALNVNIGTSGGQALKAGVVSGMKVSVGEGALAIHNIVSALPQLLRARGRHFFQVLLRVVPVSVNLHAVIKTEGPVSPEHVNKQLVEFSSHLKKMVQTNVLPNEKAILLLKQTVRELKAVLEGKLDTKLIKCPCISW